ncbi:hypothetical protein ABZ825_39430 [Streptomyces tauricus]|uniref:hypothetical protein n=1 Tax=Streptomyces tauricus TaxID=68274 RepID=UPI0033E1487E
MFTDPVQLQRYIEFQLARLGSHNAHHQFEDLCLAVARKRLASNLMPSTGPVSSGGDQGRDAETHWTDISSASPDQGRTSVFNALVSAEPAAMACTLQRTRLPAKIRKDLASICSQGEPVTRVFYFAIEPLAKGQRAALVAEARKKHGIQLEIWDAQLLAMNLTDRDLRHVARRYLHVARRMIWSYAILDHLGFLTPGALAAVLSVAVVAGSAPQHTPQPAVTIPLQIDNDRTVNPPNSQGSYGPFLTDLGWTSMIPPGSRLPADAKLVLVPDTVQYDRARLVVDLRLDLPCGAVPWTVSTREDQTRSGTLTSQHPRQHVDMPIPGRTPVTVTITLTGKDACNPAGVTVSSPRIEVCEPGEASRSCKANPFAPPSPPLSYSPTHSSDLTGGSHAAQET